MSASMSSPTITVSAGLGPQLGERGLEVRAAGLADDLGLDACRVLEPGDEGARVEQRPARGLPPAVPVQADEARAGVELRERSVQLVVGEHARGLLGLVGPADEDDLGVPLDELDRARRDRASRPPS